jgi:hypothetical protein
MNLGRGAEDSSMTRLCSMFRLTVNRVHTQLVPRRLGHANQYGRRSCPTSGWLARLLTHAQWCDVCSAVNGVVRLGCQSTVCILAAPNDPERWIAVAAVITIATAMALLFLGWEHQYAR